MTRDELQRLRREMEGESQLDRSPRPKKLQSRPTWSPIASSTGTTVNGSPKARSGPFGSPRAGNGSSPRTTRIASPRRPSSTSSSSELNGVAPASPASRLASSYRARQLSDTSSTLSNGNFEKSALDVNGTPLIHQKMEFGGKLSHDSVASPLKSRSSPPGAAEAPFAAGVLPPSSRGQFTRSLLPMSASALMKNRLSQVSVGSSDEGDRGDHLPPPSERDWNPSGSAGSGSTAPGLKEDDLRFLADFSPETNSRRASTASGLWG